MITDFAEIRGIGVSQSQSKWYAKFCGIWDTSGINAAQTYLLTLPKVFANIAKISTNIAGSSGCPFNRHELYALRHPEKRNTCICGNFLEYNSTNKTWQLGCSRKCAAQARSPKNKATCLEKYGVENPSQSDKIKEKKSKTMLDNFGSTHWTKAEHMQHKLTSFNANTLKKCKATRVKKYGVDNPFKSKEIQDLIRLSNLDKYGGNPGSIPNGYNRKLYTDRFGTVHAIQGYEPRALAYFDKIKSIVRIETMAKEVPC